MNTFLLLMLKFACVTSVYINKVVVRVPGGREAIQAIAARHGCRVLGSVGSLPDYYVLEHSKIAKYHPKPSTLQIARLANEDSVEYVNQEVLLKRHKREIFDMSSFNDPLIDNMWFVKSDFNLNVQAAWRDGWTGLGIVVTIVDDGIERSNDDLAKNYDPLASYDYNDNDPDPMPRYDAMLENSHGTRCAGLVAAAANNSVCAAGLAFNAYIGGIRMLDGDYSDVLEGSSLSHAIHHVDIFSSSWGPPDDGLSVEGPGALATKALQHGTNLGRAGKGCIYVWASGNGGRTGDTCSVDGYVTSIYTIAVNSVTSSGRFPWFGEKCSSILTSTFSSGYSSSGDKTVVTADIPNKCTKQFTGTSAASPMAAGVLALVLEANKYLTWRDIQYVTLMSAKSDQLTDGQWSVNGAGRKFSHLYGYGIMDAYSMINLAKTWTSVPNQRKCVLKSAPYLFITGNSDGSTIHIEHIQNLNCSCRDNVQFLEHVELRVDVQYNKRGALGIALTSPMNTRSVVLFQRPKDKSNGKYNDVSLMSVHFWGERALGMWTVEFINHGTDNNSGYLSKIEITLYGTSIDPLAPRNSRDTTASLNLTEYCGEESVEETTTLTLETITSIGSVITDSVETESVNSSNTAIYIAVGTVCVAVILILLTVGIVYFYNKKRKLLRQNINQRIQSRPYIISSDISSWAQHRNHQPAYFDNQAYT